MCILYWILCKTIQMGGIQRTSLFRNWWLHLYWTCFDVSRGRVIEEHRAFRETQKACETYKYFIWHKSRSSNRLIKYWDGETMDFRIIICLEIVQVQNCLCQNVYEYHYCLYNIWNAESNFRQYEHEWNIHYMQIFRVRLKASIETHTKKISHVPLFQ